MHDQKVTLDPTDEHFLFQTNYEGEAQHRTRTISTTIAVNAPHGVAAALFSPLSFLRPSARSFNIVGKSCGAAPVGPLPPLPFLVPTAPLLPVPYGITYPDEKDKRRAENICTFKEAEKRGSETGSKAKLKAPLGHAGLRARPAARGRQLFA